MPEDLKTVADRLFSAAASIQGTSLSRSNKTLSNYLRLLFPEIAYCDGCVICPIRSDDDEGDHNDDDVDSEAPLQRDAERLVRLLGHV